jgi:hypothetical protein
VVARSARQALLVVNAGYFTEDYRAAGLLVADVAQRLVHRHGRDAGGARRAGQCAGCVSRSRRAGLRAGRVGRDAAEHGGVPPAEADTRVLPRPWASIGQGGLFVIAPPVFTLHGLGAWLAGAGLELDRAFNLDGGQSTGLWLDPALAPSFGDRQAAQVDSAVAIPAVLVVRR